VVAAGVEPRRLERAARHFTTAPSANLVRHYLDTRLVAQLEIGDLEARANALLTERLPPDLARHPWKVAFDLTRLPSYGDYLAEPTEWRRGAAKAGTTRFHAYATASVARAGRRLTLALPFVSADDRRLDIVEELRARLPPLGVRSGRLLLDRAFASVAVLRFLDPPPFTAIVALPKRGTRRKAQLAGRGQRKTRYPMRSAEAGELTFPWWVAVRDAAGRRGKHGRESLAFAVVGQAHGERSGRQVAAADRGRCGLESSSRLRPQGLAGTSSRDPWRRLRLVSVGLLLTNLWVWLQATLLAHTPRAERAAARTWLEQTFRLDRLRALLLEASKARYQVHTALAYPFRLLPSFTFGGSEIGKY
jgi:hypothetical protein